LDVKKKDNVHVQRDGTLVVKCWAPSHNCVGKPYLNYISKLNDIQKVAYPTFTKVEQSFHKFQQLANFTSIKMAEERASGAPGVPPLREVKMKKFSASDVTYNEISRDAMHNVAKVFGWTARGKRDILDLLASEMKMTKENVLSRLAGVTITEESSSIEARFSGSGFDFDGLKSGKKLSKKTSSASKSSKEGKKAKKRERTWENERLEELGFSPIVDSPVDDKKVCKTLWDDIDFIDEADSTATKSGKARKQVVSTSSPQAADSTATKSGKARKHVVSTSSPQAAVVMDLRTPEEKVVL
jgi:hypothetical protein